MEDIDKWRDRIIDQNNDHLQVERKEEIRTLRRALKILDTNKREALVHSRLHGMKYFEIGQLLDIS